MDTSKPIRAAIYLRCARQDQIAIDAQEHICKEYSSRKGYEIAGIYTDNGVAGTSGSRPALDRLRADAAAGAFDKIAVADYSRIARRPQQAAKLFDEMKKHGVAIESTKEGALV